MRPIVGQEAEHTMLTLADRIRAEGHNDGRSEGLNEGLNKGLSEGQRQLVLRLLARRFGALPPDVEARVARAEMDELLDWAMRLLDARSLDEVFTPA